MTGPGPDWTYLRVTQTVTDAIEVLSLAINQKHRDDDQHEALRRMAQKLDYQTGGRWVDDVDETRCKDCRGRPPCDITARTCICAVNDGTRKCPALLHVWGPP